MLYVQYITCTSIKVDTGQNQHTLTKTTHRFFGPKSTKGPSGCRRADATSPAVASSSAIPRKAWLKTEGQLGHQGPARSCCLVQGGDDKVEKVWNGKHVFSFVGMLMFLMLFIRMVFSG